MTTCIIAGSYAEYMDFLGEHHYSPREYRYISEKHQLWGMRGSKVELVGRSWLRNDLIKEALNQGLLKSL
ncbi:hypothetical protein LCGC14_1744020 [marine sediment metagenome]|uniref:Uncharacterized protein n=1 Tax=marine sediment metagenome TaxID=412755 RepID=A0A0F9K5G6_9ZZZZ